MARPSGRPERAGRSDQRGAGVSGREGPAGTARQTVCPEQTDLFRRRAELRGGVSKSARPPRLRAPDDLRDVLDERGMRICLLSARFPPQRCGVGDYTYFLGCALAERGHDVHALTSTGALDAIRYPLPRRFTAHRVIDAWDVRRVPSIMRHVIKLRPDVLLIEYTPHAFDRRGLTLAVNLVPLLTRFVPNTRVVTNFHELYMPLRGPVPHRVAAAWQRVAALGTAATSQGVCVTAPLWKRLLRGLGVRKSIGVIPVGSNIPRVAMTAEERRDVRRELLPDGDGMLIAGFGALHDRDLGLVAEALAYLKHERRARLIWLGGGDGGRQSRDSVARQVRERGLAEGALLWTGVIPHHEVSKLLAACDVMTWPFVDGR